MIRSSALALAFGCALVLLVVEGLARIVPPTNRFVTYRDASIEIYEPNRSFVYKGPGVGRLSEFRVRKTTNSLGYADHEYALTKPAGTGRVVVLGDSQVEALQVRLEESFHKRLETRLRAEGRDVEVIALGRSGYGAAEALATYRDHARAYAPDLVVWSFTDQNDVHDAHPELGQAILDGWALGLRRPPTWLHGSILASFVYSRRWRGSGASSAAERDRSDLLPGRFAVLAGDGSPWSLREPTYLADPPPMYAEAIRRFEHDLIALIDTVRAHGVPILVASTAGQPYKHYLPRRHPEFRWDPTKLDDLAERIAEARGVPFLRMKDAFELRRTATGEPVVYRLDGHLNEAGHEVVAEQLYGAVRAMLFTPQP